MPLIHLLILFFAGALSALAATSEEEVFKIPLNRIDRYKPSIYGETVDSTRMSRVRLKGRNDLLYDPIPNMIWQRGYPLASAAFYNRLEPRIRYEVTSFSADLLEQDFGVALVMSYLRSKEQEYAEAGYEILLAPEKTTGAARFRLFGQRALSFTYSFMREEQLIIRGENWIERDGVIHIVAIEAPTRRAFDAFFERVRQAMNSMSETNQR